MWSLDLISDAAAAAMSLFRCLFESGGEDAITAASDVDGVKVGAVDMSEWGCIEAGLTEDSVA